MNLVVVGRPPPKMERPREVLHPAPKVMKLFLLILEAENLRAGTKMPLAKAFTLCSHGGHFVGVPCRRL
jgi:hypothetical protein